MKRIIIAIFFILLSVLIGIYSLVETERICNKMIIELEYATKENKEATESSSHQKRIDFYETTTKIKSSWEKNSKFFYIFFNNDYIKTIETNIEQLPEHAKNGDLESRIYVLLRL